MENKAKFGNLYYLKSGGFWGGRNAPLGWNLQSCWGSVLLHVCPTAKNGMESGLFGGKNQQIIGFFAPKSIFSARVLWATRIFRMLITAPRFSTLIPPSSFQVENLMKWGFLGGGSSKIKERRRERRRRAGRTLRPSGATHGCAKEKYHGSRTAAKRVPRGHRGTPPQLGL